jgi:hypothetical protein
VKEGFIISVRVPALSTILKLIKVLSTLPFLDKKCARQSAVLTEAI